MGRGRRKGRTVADELADEPPESSAHHEDMLLKYAVALDILSYVAATTPDPYGTWREELTFLWFHCCPETSAMTMDLWRVVAGRLDTHTHTHAHAHMREHGAIIHTHTYIDIHTYTHTHIHMYMYIYESRA